MVERSGDAGRIHTLDWQDLGLSSLGVPQSAAQSLDLQLDYYERFLGWAAAGTPQRILEAALRWLRDNRCSPARVTLCWGDSRLPNLIFRDDRVVGVLDWEMAFLGDPEADLGWWLFLDWHHSEGNGIPRLEGFPSREETVRRYEELTGWKVESLAYYEIMAAFRFGVIMLSLARNFTERGLTGMAEIGWNNAATRRLADALHLPPPGQPAEGLGKRARDGSARAVSSHRPRRRRLVRAIERRPRDEARGYGPESNTDRHRLSV